MRMLVMIGHLFAEVNLCFAICSAWTAFTATNVSTLDRGLADLLKELRGKAVRHIALWHSKNGMALVALAQLVMVLYRGNPLLRFESGA